jgi:hypothetical protein
LRNGAEQQAFDLKRQAGSRAIHHIGAPRWEMIEEDFALPRRCEARSERPLSDASSPPAPSSAAKMEGAVAHSNVLGAFRACPGRLVRSHLPVRVHAARSLLPFRGSGRGRPDEREPRVDDIDASPSRSAMSRGCGLVVS